MIKTKIIAWFNKHFPERALGFGPSSYGHLLRFYPRNFRIDINTGEFQSEAHVDAVLYDFAVSLKTTIGILRPDLNLKSHLVKAHKIILEKAPKNPQGN